MAWTPRWKPLVPAVFLTLFFSAASAAADYSTHPAAGPFIDEMVNKHGFNRAEVTALLAGAQRQDKILEAISKPAEKTMTWGRYRNIFLGEGRIAEGVVFWQQNEAALARAFETYKVPPDYVVAIIGVETRFGQHRGAWRVIDALTTLGFDYPPRAAFFRSELVQFLLLVREEKHAADTVMGSYAGAMGYGQFISSSYRNYAVDFDGDGTRDIWDNTTDAIGSVASYFARHGWQGGMPLLVDVPRASAAMNALVTTDPKPVRTLADVRATGFNAYAGLPANTPVAVLQFEHETGLRTAVTFRDFYVITRYNHSPLYARAVHELAQAIRTVREAAVTAAKGGVPEDRAPEGGAK